MIAKLVKGSGFRGALEYDLRQEKGVLLDTNMSGRNPRTLAKEFGEIRAFKPNLTKAVCHVSLSIGPDEKLSDQQWIEVAHQYLDGMGFGDSQYVVTKHTDTEHPHIHILANRVNLKGAVVSDSHDYQRQETIMRQVEKDFGLTPIKSSKEVRRKALAKGEIEKALRTSQAPARLQLQRMIDDALSCPCDLSHFINELSQQDVGVKLNQAQTGTISGLSFIYDGIAFKGSSLGKGYSWPALQKRGLSYEQIRTGHEPGRQDEPAEKNSRPGNERGGVIGNEAGSFEPARNAEIEKQRRIDENFERLARANQGGQPECPEGRARSQGLSR